MSFKQMWKLATEFGEMLSKGLDLAKTVGGGLAEPGVAEKREEICNKCPALLISQGHKYCNKCGCGVWRGARLDDGKLKWRDLKCPLGKF
jgi:hypothetical protein